MPIVTEVPISLLQMPTYVGASTRLDGLTWGAEDLGAEIGAAANREADGSVDLALPAGARPDACSRRSPPACSRSIPCSSISATAAASRGKREAAARDGFTGKMAIHPDQVAVINAAFTPTEAAVAHARAIVKLFADNPGSGALSLDGQMVDIPHLKHAERLLARAALG